MPSTPLKPSPRKARTSTPGHGHGINDPHFWFDPLRVKRAVDHIAARLSALDPDGGDDYENNASRYNELLMMRTLGQRTGRHYS